ncbi:polyprenyl synthetase family protein [Allobacillus sp. GCM10007491]|uniref:Farnesyl diphosphate synthase n=1 Tax=Allobacillus saliphilus TaxID=2912308 RepID=A0A941HSW1_9BACI|nr:polyprenyl synthetase family protein [Allobacillus saliphilus]
MTINRFILNKQKLIDKKLIELVEELEAPSLLKEAIEYAIKAGGKRLRPILLMSTYEGFSTELKKATHPAVALELIHTYSLIHDDLPAMDDDDLRRGQPTLHRQFDEATAILVGDGLLTYAFQLISSSPFLEAEEKVYVIQQLSQASGVNGMVGGQYLDLKAENEEIEEHELSTIHIKKTGALIQAAIKIGAYLGGATPPQIESLQTFGYYLGLTFQVQDDLLDVEGDSNELGKLTGSDLARNKSTYPKLLGLQGAKDQKNQYMDKAKEAYLSSNVDQPRLLELINVFGNRSN